MNIKFINRQDELSFLEGKFKEQGAQFVVVYGRRRVGKTELIKQLFRDKPHIYFLADKGPEKEQLKELSSKVMEFFGDKSLAEVGIPDWVKLFEYIKEKAEKRFIIVIDEFPYLTGANKAIPSLLQKGWDEYLQEKNIFLILCGSSISMMEKGVLSYRSPLYGRRTGQIKLEPLRFKDMLDFFPQSKFKEVIEFYSVLGGIPAYLIKFSGRDVFSNVKEKILKKGELLYEEPEFILREELREPTNYFSIIKAISFGKTRINEISQISYLPVVKIPRYLGVLERLNILKREVPITERNPARSKKGLYKIQDNLFRFWFRYVYPNKSDIEEGKVDLVLEKIIKPSFDQFVSYVFEDISRQGLLELSKQRKLPIDFTKIGKWWYKGDEIDLVALNDLTKEILFAECKWQAQKVGKELVEELLKKKELVDWNKGRRKEYFAIFSRAGFTESCSEYCRENNILSFDLKALEKIFSQSK